MTINKINIDELTAKVKTQLKKEKGLSPALKTSIEMMLFVVLLLVDRLGLNSKNSSTPPSADPNRKKNPKRKTDKKPGGQNGHKGTTLQQVEAPNIIRNIPIDRGALPKGEYQSAGYESRQVFDIEISTVITEYRAEVVIDEKGRCFVAPFPAEVSRPVQYGAGVKENSVYMSLFQLIPYNRIEDHFADQFGIPISGGTIFNFNQEAYKRLEGFEEWLKKQLISSAVIHADETGINIGGKRVWLHNLSTPLYTFFLPHQKRGHEANDDMSVLPFFTGTLCHDHWKPYYRYTCDHSLCNAHHLRELERALEVNHQQWSKAMIDLLLEINNATNNAGGYLEPPDAEVFRKRYRELIQKAELECPHPNEKREKGKRGRVPRSKSRNLLERLRDYEDDVLRFMTRSDVQFSNNQAENDLRMTKVQQKISGCFRSWDGAQIFCRVRSYLSTSRKHGVSAAEALHLLFEGNLPEFVKL